MADPILHPEDVDLFRSEALAMMPDTCSITVPDPTQTRTLNRTTGQLPAVDRVVIYGPGAVDLNTREPLEGDDVLAGVCRFQVKADINSNVVETTAGEKEWTYLTFQLQLPMAGTGHIPIDAVAECLTAPYDESLPGRVFNIQGTYHKSHAVIRRFRLREVIA